MSRRDQCSVMVPSILSSSPVSGLESGRRYSGEPDWTSLAHLVVTQSMYMHVIGNIVYVYKREEVDTQLSGIETV